MGRNKNQSDSDYVITLIQYTNAIEKQYHLIQLLDKVVQIKYIVF